MTLIIIRNVFEELLVSSFLILPLFLIWLAFCLFIKKVDKKSFCRKLHKYTGIFLGIAILFPIMGYFISQFSFGEQKYFRSYDYFISSEPAKGYSFADEMPEDVREIEYYCYQEPLQIGNVVGICINFSELEVAEEYYQERISAWNSMYGDEKYSTYEYEGKTLPGDKMAQEDLEKYLSEFSDCSIDDYNILLYYENGYGNERRWILFGESKTELIEIFSKYAY